MATAAKAASSSKGKAPKKPALPVLFEDIAIAQTRIRGGVERTPLTHSHWLSQLCGCEVYLKHEQTMFTGSFKERGARNALLSLDNDRRKRGVVAASAGNHALALSWHGKQLGIPVSVLMPTVAPLAKRDKCAKFGANIVVHGDNIGVAKAFAETDPAFADMTYVNGYDDVPIIAGAGTLGLELVDQADVDFDYVMVPCGGAGLLAGVSLAVKTLRPETRVIGVEPRNCASFTAALAAGAPTECATTSTLADGLAVPTVGSNAFAVAREYTDDVCIVEESDVALAVLRLLENEKVTVEGGGATGLAAILPGGPYHEKVQGKKVAVPLCGGNIDVTTLGRVIDRGMAADCRLVRFVAEGARSPPSSVRPFPSHARAPPRSLGPLGRHRAVHGHPQGARRERRRRGRERAPSLHSNRDLGRARSREHGPTLRPRSER